MLYHIFCDESRQSQDRFMVLGGLIIPAEGVEVFNDTMEQYRKQTNMMAELKWSKVSDQKLAEYKTFIEYFFALNNTGRLQFHCMIVDNHQINHRKYNESNPELGFYKFYYQLLLHAFGRRYCKADSDARFIIYLDNRTTKYKLSTLKVILNRGIAKKYGVEKEPFRNIEPQDSKMSNQLQVGDLLIGAVGYQKNGYQLIAGAKKAKIELAEHIASAAGLADLKTDTMLHNRRFTIWNFKMRK